MIASSAKPTDAGFETVGAGDAKVMSGMKQESKGGRAAVDRLGLVSQGPFGKSVSKQLFETCSAERRGVPRFKGACAIDGGDQKVDSIL
jgi:hypothetical protein